MSFQVIQPPSEEKALAEVGLEIVKAAATMGLNFDVQGFITAWVSGTRVLVERNTEGSIATLCLLALGKTWTRQDYTATILELSGGNTDGMFEFARNIAAALGVTSLYRDTTEPFPTPINGIIKRTVTQYVLQ